MSQVVSIGTYLPPWTVQQTNGSRVPTKTR